MSVFPDVYDRKTSRDGSNLNKYFTNNFILAQILNGGFFSDKTLLTKLDKFSRHMFISQQCSLSRTYRQSLHQISTANQSSSVY